MRGIRSVDNHKLSTNSAVSGESQRDLFVVLIKRMRTVSVLCGISGLVGLLSIFLRLESNYPAVGISVMVASTLTIIQAFVYFRPTAELEKITKAEVVDVDSMMRGLAALAAGFKVLATLVVTIAIFVVVSVAVRW